MHTSSASSVSPPTSVREMSSRSSSVARDCSSSVNVKQFVVEAEVRSHVELKVQPTVSSTEFKLPALPSQELRKESNTAPNVNDDQLKKESTDAPNVNDDQLMEECKLEAPSVVANQSENVGTRRRRKDLITPPTKLSERIDTAKKQKTESSTDQVVSEKDPDFYQDWSGGSRYEVDNKPWNILGWLVDGIGKRLQRK